MLKNAYHIRVNYEPFNNIVIGAEKTFFSSFLFSFQILYNEHVILQSRKKIKASNWIILAFRLAKDILDHLGVKDIKLLTNNPQKVGVLVAAGINVVERLPIVVGLNPENSHYLNVKAEKLGHKYTL